MNALSLDRVEAIIQEVTIEKQRFEKMARILDLYLEMLEEYRKSHTEATA